MLIVKLTIVFILTGPNFSAQAQYIKLSKGQPVPFDTAVVTEINTYRQETLKFKSSDLLIIGYSAEISNLTLQVAASDSVTTTLTRLNKSLVETVAIKQSTINELSREYDALLRINKARNSWLQRNKFWLGFISGAAGVYSLIKL